MNEATEAQIMYFQSLILKLHSINYFIICIGFDCNGVVKFEESKKLVDDITLIEFFIKNKKKEKQMRAYLDDVSKFRLLYLWKI